MTIGEKIKLTICVNYRAGVVVEFPELNQQIGVFAVKRVEGGTHQDRNGMDISRRTKLGVTYVRDRTPNNPPAEDKVQKGRSGEDTVVTNEVTVAVKGVLKRRGRGN